MNGVRFTLIEMLVVIAIIGIIAALLSGPVMGARVSALKASCASNLSQIGKSVALYESPGAFDRIPSVHNEGIIWNPGTGLPILALFRANYLDTVAAITCPVGLCPYGVNDRNGLPAGCNVFDNASDTSLSARNQTHYLFTWYYTKNCSGSRVIAGDAGAMGSPGYSPNHGDKSLEADSIGVNALFKDGHVKVSRGDYTVEGAQRIPGATTDGNLWTFGSVSNTGGGMGTQIGCYE